LTNGNIDDGADRAVWRYAPMVTTYFDLGGQRRIQRVSVSADVEADHFRLWSLQVFTSTDGDRYVFRGDLGFLGDAGLGQHTWRSEVLDAMARYVAVVAEGPGCRTHMTLGEVEILGESSFRPSPGVRQTADARISRLAPTADSGASAQTVRGARQGITEAGDHRVAFDHREIH